MNVYYRANQDSAGAVRCDHNGLHVSNEEPGGESRPLDHEHSHRMCYHRQVGERYGAPDLTNVAVDKRLRVGGFAGARQPHDQVELELGL